MDATEKNKAEGRVGHARVALPEEATVTILNRVRREGLEEKVTLD